MRLLAIGDSNFDGFFECCFIEGDKKYSLVFDLDNWVSTQKHGM